MPQLERYSFLDTEPPRRARDGSYTAALPVVRRVGPEQLGRADTSHGLVEGSRSGARDGQAAGEHGQHGGGAARRDGQDRRARATSTSSIATCASIDDGLFGALVAAFPSPPAESPASPALDSPSFANARRGSLRPSLPPPCPPPRAPLPPLPTSGTSSSMSFVPDGALSMATRAPPSPLSPAPSSSSNIHVGLGINVSRPTRRDSLSPTTALPRPLSFSPYPSPPCPSPSSPNFAQYTLYPTRTSYGMQKPLPPLPDASGSPTSPRFRRLPPTPPRDEPVLAGLVQHSFAPPSTPDVSTAYGTPLVESPVDMHTSTLRPPPPSPTSPPRRRTRTSTASTTSTASRSSLDLGNITADLSELAESFGRVGPSVGADDENDGELDAGEGRDVKKEQHKQQPGEEEEEDGEEAQRALVRRVRSTIELQRRKASVASSVASRTGRGSVASEAGSTFTTGGYRAYKLTRRSSFLPSSPTTTRRRRTTSSTSSRSSSTSDSEAEELFDLSLDTPTTSPALEREGFGWPTMSGVGRRYGRRQSSATTIESVGGGGGAGKGEGGWGPPDDEDNELKVLAPLPTRRSASSAPPPAQSVSRSALPTTRSYLAPPSTSALPRPTLSSARSTPSLRRSALPLPSPSLAAPPNSPAPPPRRPSLGAPPILPLPPVPVAAPNPGGERRMASFLPQPTTTASASASASRLRPLVTASAARTGPAAPSTVSRLPTAAATPQHPKPFIAGSAMRLPQPVGAPKGLRLPSSVAAGGGPCAVPAERARAAGHGRRSSLQMLPYLVTEQEGLSTGRGSATRLPRR
ncbi:hypothetical protein JCM8208_003592 [Rhodotorula glutinis]